MHVVFICAPFAGDRVGNVARVKRIARQLVLGGSVPLTPHLLLGSILDEDSERDLAIVLCMELLSLADEVRVYGEPTAGMLEEIAEAKRLGIPIVTGEMP